MSHYESGELITLTMNAVDNLTEVYNTFGGEVLDARLINKELTMGVILPGCAQYIDSTIEVII